MGTGVPTVGAIEAEGPRQTAQPSQQAAGDYVLLTLCTYTTQLGGATVT